MNNKIYNTDKYVIEFESYPSYGMREELFSTNILIKGNNEVEIYGTYDFKWGTKEKINGITFKISEEQKNEIIKSIEEYKIDKLEEDLNVLSCDGTFYYISLFDINGNVTKKIGGLNVNNETYRNFIYKIYSIIPLSKLNETKKNIKKTIKEKLNIK